MRHVRIPIAVSLLALLLLTGCGGTNQPSGPPPLTYATAPLGGSSTPGGANGGGQTLQIWQVQVDTLVWSPDSTRLALALAKNTGEVFQVWDAASGKQLSTYSGQLGNSDGMAWSPDGARIASAGGVYAGGDSTHLRIWDATTGSPIISLVSDSQSELSSVQTFAWLNGGARIATLVETWPRPTQSNPNPPGQDLAPLFLCACRLLSLPFVWLDKRRILGALQARSVRPWHRDGIGALGARSHSRILVGPGRTPPDLIGTYPGPAQVLAPL